MCRNFCITMFYLALYLRLNSTQLKNRCEQGNEIHFLQYIPLEFVILKIGIKLFVKKLCCVLVANDDPDFGALSFIFVSFLSQSYCFIRPFDSSSIYNLHVLKLAGVRSHFYRWDENKRTKLCLNSNCRSFWINIYNYWQQTYQCWS